MKRIFGIIAFAALLSPAVAAAQETSAAASTTDERRLTPEQVEAILAEAAKKHATPAKQLPEPTAPADEDAPPLPPQVHGEVGFAIGSGGYRETFGTAIYPLGEDGFAAISLDFVDWGHRHWPY